MKVEPYIISATLRGVIYQRLLKRICTTCKSEYVVTKETAELYGLNELKTAYKGKGCTVCNGTGYKGRFGVFEILLVDKNLQNLIVARKSNKEMQEYLVQTGFVSMRESALKNVYLGNTTIEEFVKVCT